MSARGLRSTAKIPIPFTARLLNSHGFWLGASLRLEWPLGAAQGVVIAIDPKKIEKNRLVSSVDSIREKRTKLVFAFYLPIIPQEPENKSL